MHMSFPRDSCWNKIQLVTLGSNPCLIVTIQTTIYGTPDNKIQLWNSKVSLKNCLIFRREDLSRTFRSRLIQGRCSPLAPCHTVSFQLSVFELWSNNFSLLKWTLKLFDTVTRIKLSSPFQTVSLSELTVPLFDKAMPAIWQLAVTTKKVSLFMTSNWRGVFRVRSSYWEKHE